MNMSCEMPLDDVLIKQEPCCEYSGGPVGGPRMEDLYLIYEGHVMKEEEMAIGPEVWQVPTPATPPVSEAQRVSKLKWQIGTEAEPNPRSVETQKASIEAKVPGAEESNNAFTPSPPVHNRATDTQQCKRRKTKFVTPKKKESKADKKPTFVTPRKLQTKSKLYTLPKRRKLSTQNELKQDNTPKPSVCEDRASNIEVLKANKINHFIETQKTQISKTVKDKACEDSSTNDSNNIDCISKSTFTCNVCSKQFNTKSSLIQHLHSHNSYFLCNECSYNTVSRDTFEKHLHLHDKSRPHQCDECSNRYTTKQHLQTHVSRVHRKDTVSIKRHSCDICDYKTDDISHLKNHLYMHAGIKPYSCSVCTYKCIRRSTLKAHIRIHTGEKPFSCSICTYKCIKISTLKRHVRTHTGEKPFSCSVCTYKCSCRSDLKKHVRTHTGEKPFSCSVCTYKCSQISNLKVHEKTHTG